MPLEHPEKLAGHGDTAIVEMVRQLRDVLHDFRDTQKVMQAEVHDINARTIGLEQREERVSRAEREIERLTGKVEAISQTQAQQQGAAKLAEFFGKYWQSLALAGGALAYVVKNGGIG